MSRDGSRGGTGLLRWAGTLAALGLVGLVALFVTARLAVQSGVHDVEAVALTRQPAGDDGGRDDRVGALVRVAGDENAPLDLRNQAVWALGQVGDERALPALERLHVQEKCDHEHLLCQREVRRAIATIDEGYTLRGELRRLWHEARE